MAIPYELIDRWQDILSIPISLFMCYMLWKINSQTKPKTTEIKMEIKLRGKRWKQISKAAYVDLEGFHRATFHDWNYGEITYFKEITPCKCDCHMFVGGSGKGCPDCIKEGCGFCVEDVE